MAEIGNISAVALNLWCRNQAESSSDKARDHAIPVVGYNAAFPFRSMVLKTGWVRNSELRFAIPRMRNQEDQYSHRQIATDVPRKFDMKVSISYSVVVSSSEMLIA